MKRRLISKSPIPKTFKEWFYLWLCGFGELINGVIGILSLGFIRGNFAMKAAIKLTRVRSKY